MNNQLSIIIPVMNDAAALCELLPFLLQYAPAQEILVVEAPDSHDSAETVCQSHQVRFIISPKCGRASQMNFGASKATSDVFLFLHADVLPPTSFVKHILKKINAGKELGLFKYQFSPTNKWLDFNASFTGKPGIFTGGGDQCHFMTKSFFEKMGGYDETYVIMEDFALIRAAKNKKIEYSIIQDPATVSSRKYENNSYFWVNFINFTMLMAFFLGAKPETLKKVYQKAIS